MRLTSVEAREMFSFGTLLLGELPQTLVVVGPNGAGKTNVVRVCEVVQAALDRAGNFSQEAYQLLARFARSRRLGAAPADLSSVRLGIALTETWERELLVCFIRAAIASSLLQGTATNSDTSGAFGWVRQNVDESLLEVLTCGEIVVDFADAPVEPWTISYEFQAGGERFRWVLEGMPSRGQILRVTDARRLGVPCHSIAQKLSLDEQRVPGKPLTLADLLPPPGEGRMLTLEAGSQWAELTREFAARADIPFDLTQRRGSSLAEVLQVVLSCGLVLLGDLREPPRFVYSVEDAAADPALTDGSRVPVRLFRLKNGTASQRRRYAAIQAVFQGLTRRTFDIALAGPLSQGEEPASLQVSVLVAHADGDLPIEFAGAGVWEALLLSAVLPESAGVVAVLDEPARNLHPTLQRRLLTEMRRAPGQFIVTTHSPYLVSLTDDRDLAGIVRLDTKDSVTRVHHIEQTGQRDMARLRKALGESADARALVFARGVILVEGGTELGALPEWFSKSSTAERHGTPDALNVEIFSVDGDTNFGTFAGFLHELGVPWAIVCDGAVYRPDKRKAQIFEQVLAAGIGDASLRQAVTRALADSQADFRVLRSVGEMSGIFTLADGWDKTEESFEAYIDTVAPESLAAAAQVVGRSKPRQGRHVASTTKCPSEVDELYGKLLRRLDVA
jgi:hypothetical protein